MAAVPTAVAAPPICTEEDLKPPFDMMNATCVAMLSDAIAHDTPLTQQDRCACYEQVDDAVGLALACMTMPAKKMTLAQEYQLCIAEGMGVTCSDAEMFGDSGGLAELSSSCKEELQETTAGDDVARDLGCGCFGNVKAEKAFNLRCKSLKGNENTVAKNYQDCVNDAFPA